MAATKQMLVHWGETANLFQTFFCAILCFHLASSSPLQLSCSKLWHFLFPKKLAKKNERVQNHFLPL